MDFSDQLSNRVATISPNLCKLHLVALRKIQASRRYFSNLFKNEQKHKIFLWSGQWESDPPLRLGKPAYYRCTMPACEGKMP